MHREHNERAGLLSYIGGNRKGREAHDLEREAMQDSFLADALDGYDSIDDPEPGRLRRMEEKVRLQSVQRNNIAVAGGLRDMRPPMPMPHVMCETGCEASPNMHEPRFETRPDMSSIPESDLQQPAKRSRRRCVYRLATASVMLCACIAAYELGRMNGTESGETVVQSSIAADSAAESSERLTGRQSNEAQPRKDYERATSAASPAVAPRPAGGYGAYYEYIYDRLAAASPDIRKSGGVVVLDFTVDETGRPHGFEVVESPSPETAETLIRIIGSGPAWTCAREVHAFAVPLRQAEQ